MDIVICVYVEINVVVLVCLCVCLRLCAEEEKFLEQGMLSQSKTKTSFYHYEEKFMKCDQTVVIWCLKDFLRKKE